MDLHNKERTKKKSRRRKSRFSAVKEKISKIFNTFSGHKITNFSSFNGFSNLMHQKADAASIGIGRMLFGIMMLLDIPEERSGDLDLRWGDPKDCRFPLFSFIKPLTLPKMGLVYCTMWLGALGITLGYKFKASCLAFVLTYWYIFLLDKSSWNNHSYLYGLIAFIFLFTDAHHYCSIDARCNELKPEVPYWNYFLLKFQFFVLYFIAGLKKMSSEWLNEWQYSMTNLDVHWLFTPFRMIIGSDLTNLLVIHWFAAVFDTTISFFLICKHTRPIAVIFATAFHLMNSHLFNIGMFPWVCLVELPLFYEHNWPRTFFRKLKSSSSFSKRKASMERMSCVNDKNVTTKRTLKKRFTTFLILIYGCLQLFLPFSHFITKGYNNWVNGIYGYSFDMMMQQWHPSLISIKIVDNGGQQQHFIDPLTFTDNYRWTQYPDMAYQYAKCIHENLKSDFHENPNSVLTSANISIYFDIWCSLNGRFQQRIYNPKVDLVKSYWNPFRKPSFTLPLLREYSHLRKEIMEISNDVYSWSNYTSLMFFADFPRLTMENYIVPEMDNVTLTVLHGAVKFQQENDTKASSLSVRQSVVVKSGSFHKITTISDVPSCYFYTYINATQQLLNSPADDTQNYKEWRTTYSIFPFAQEWRMRWENYKKFLYHIANSILFEFYKVPMPLRVREIHDM
ncbi:CLUMA_CG009257, isoform A [Clunio marinus]|uniref:CLUMA_CG009257, isoform A n=1 Tax=Clunio marinus TaxID=568069 RepID=A0A1J1IBI4_9DIPT|nr:CLUMA_CG009257, isoform A [Clunio marinus]